MSFDIVAVPVAAANESWRERGESSGPLVSDGWQSRNRRKFGDRVPCPIVGWKPVRQDAGPNCRFLTEVATDSNRRPTGG